jgi:Domain of unknown function (DUF4333)
MRRLTAAAAAAAALLLVACSPDASDFQEEAEKYIESREFSEDAGLLRYTEVECAEPASTEEDTHYTCTATAEDGSRWQFDVEIIGKKDLRVLIPPTALSGSPTDSSVPAGPAPASTARATTTSTAATTSTGAATTTAAG